MLARRSFLGSLLAALVVPWVGKARKAVPFERGGLWTGCGYMPKYDPITAGPYQVGDETYVFTANATYVLKPDPSHWSKMRIRKLAAYR